ncbi:hypothetical protein D3C76_1474760 [compost metagenome]
MASCLGTGGTERVSSKIGITNSTVIAAIMVNVKKPDCFITFRPIMGPIDIARLEDSPKYPMPSPIRETGMICDTTVGRIVLATPNPNPYIALK